VIEERFEPEGGPSTLNIPYNGRNKKLKKMLGDKATIVMNIKLDDPETSRQIPALKTVCFLCPRHAPWLCLHP
jgi:hypothetical protein